MFKQMTVTASVLGLAALASAFASTAAVRPIPADSVAASRAYLHSFNVPGHGVALEGYSPVSYFEGKAERGSALFAVEQRGITYHLTNAAQVATFHENPGKYEPAFGGWCAFGMAVSDKFPVDPTNYLIVDGKLCVFLRNANIDARELWTDGDVAELQRNAAAHWKKVQG